MSRRQVGHAMLGAALLCAPGCGSAPVLHRAVDPGCPETAPGSLHDYRGVIHIHSQFSHDSNGDLGDLLEAARSAGSDFILITDHDDHGARTWRGLHDGTLVVVGVEFSTEVGHLLAWGFDAELGQSLPASQLIEQVHGQGGEVVLAHPFGKDAHPVDESLPRILAMEIYNLATDTRESWFQALLQLPRYLFDRRGAVRSLQDRPAPNLELWDRLTQDRPVVGVGGSNAHLRWYLSYEPAFQLITTHALAASLDEESILGALAAGRCYVAFEATGESKGFEFRAESESGPEIIMGGSGPLRPAMSLHVEVPQPAQVELYRNGVKAGEESLEDHGRFEVGEPGVYRVEVFRNGELWILSNPIYLGELES